MFPPFLRFVPIIIPYNIANVGNSQKAPLTGAPIPNPLPPPGGAARCGLVPLKVATSVFEEEGGAGLKASACFSSKGIISWEDTGKSMTDSKITISKVFIVFIPMASIII